MSSASHPLGLLALLGVAVVLIAVSFALAGIQRARTIAGMRLLILAIYSEVERLTEQGCNLLVPHDGDTGTMRVRVRVEDGVAVIESEKWRGVTHRYAIYKEQCRIRREVFGDSLTAADYVWRDGRLTLLRLEYLVGALRSTYSPRRRTTVA